MSSMGQLFQEGMVIYIKGTIHEDKDGMWLNTGTGTLGPTHFLSSEWYTEEGARKELCNDEIKFGDMVFPVHTDGELDDESVVYLGNKDGGYYTLSYGDDLSFFDETLEILRWDEVKKAPNKIELTIEEIEEKLGYEKGSLIVK